MSTTTKKDEKELASDIKTFETALSSLSYSQLSDLLKEKKEKEVEAVSHKLKEARGIVAALEAQLVNLGVGAPAKRGRKPNAFKMNGASPKPTKAKKSKGKRGAVGQAIIDFLATKGKAGAKVSEIAAAIGNKPANVTAYFYAGAGKKVAKKVAPATFALKK